MKLNKCALNTPSPNVGGRGGGALPCLLFLAVGIYFWCTAKQELPRNSAHMLGGKREEVAASFLPLGESIEAVLITGSVVLPENPLKSKIAGAHHSQYMLFSSFLLLTLFECTMCCDLGPSY